MPSKTPEIYKICLIGSGDVGTIASLVLAKSGLAHVTCVLRSKYSYVERHGWEIDSVDHGKIAGWKPHRVVRSAEEAATALAAADDDDDDDEREGKNPPVVEYDYVVLATKQLPGVSPVAEMIAPVVTRGITTLVLIQNGMGIEEEVIRAWPGNVVVSSVSHIGSAIQDPNVVVQSGRDVSKMGPHYHAGVADAVSLERARTFVDLYVRGGASGCELVEADIQGARWEKLLWNGVDQLSPH